MRFHKEGIPTLLLTFGLLVVLYIISFFVQSTILSWLLFIAGLFLLIVVLQFFRSPNRQIPLIDAKKIYSPADGKVVVIEKTEESEFMNNECWQVSIFMSPINVHSNRNPVSGTISYLKYHPGKYLAAWNPKASTDNERFTTAYRTEGDVIVMRQIAGALAKRIVNYLKVDDEVVQGDEMGFIKFGSRVDLFFPLTYTPNVELGQKVKSPIDVIAVKS